MFICEFELSVHSALLTRLASSSMDPYVFCIIIMACASHPSSSYLDGGRSVLFTHISVGRILNPIQEGIESQAIDRCNRSVDRVLQAIDVSHNVSLGLGKRRMSTFINSLPRILWNQRFVASTF